MRQFLVQQGPAPDTVTAVGLGKAEPVADNSANEGRQKSRCVEIIVSDEVIYEMLVCLKWSKTEFYRS